MTDPIVILSRLLWPSFWIPLPFFSVLLMKSRCEKKKELQKLLFISSLGYCTNECMNALPWQIWNKGWEIYSVVVWLPTFIVIIALFVIWKCLSERVVAGMLLFFTMCISVLLEWVQWHFVILGVYYLCTKNLVEERRCRQKSVALPVLLTGVGAMPCIVSIILRFAL